MRIPLLALALSGVVHAQTLPPVPAPPENPITVEKAMLGKILFWDEQLSADDTMACGTCHRPEIGGADPRIGRHPGADLLLLTADDAFGSPGVVHRDANRDYAPVALFGLDVQVTPRAAPSAFTSQWSPEQFWDGRATSQFVDPETGLVSIQSGGSLESQAVGPIRSAAEMSHIGRPWAEITAKLAIVRPLALATNLPAEMDAALQLDPNYPLLFLRAFGTPVITAERIAFAIATYERTLVADRTPWDEQMNGNGTAMTMQQRQGWTTFRTLGCDSCHVPPQFTDFTYRALGVRPWAEDPGLMATTGNFGDRGRFKVPSLRNGGLKATFMHNGAFTTWTEVFDFYDHQIPSDPDNQDPFFAAGSVPAADRPALQDFLQNALTDPRIVARQKPFDRPTLRAEQPLNVVYGVGTAGSGGVAPQLLAHQPAAVGAPDFRIGVRNALGGAPALLVVAAAPRSYPTFPVAIHVDLDQSIVFGVQPLGTGAGNGYATAPIPIPNDPNLHYAVLYTQAFVADPAAPLGIAASDAVMIPVL